MREQLPKNSPEHPPTADDNARKFIVAPLDDDFLLDHDAVSFDLIVDWLETNEDREQKLAHKTYNDGSIEIRHITKIVDEAGKRSSTKPLISSDTYKALLTATSVHLEKKRYEFSYTQAGVVFKCNYDEFADSDLRILEVDAQDEQTRQNFDPSQFPATLKEVTDDIQYHGYRITQLFTTCKPQRIYNTSAKPTYG